MISRSLAVAGLILIGASYYWIQGADGFPGFWAILPVAGSVLVIRYAGNVNCLAGRLLAWKPVVFIGKCSYSLYLWHWPVIVLAAALRLKYPDSVPLGAVISVMAAATLASYYFIERPTRKMKLVLIPVLGALAMSVALAAFLLRAEFKYDLSVFAPVEAYGASYDVAPVPPEVGEAVAGIVSAPRDASQYLAHAQDGIVRQFGGKAPSVVVLGSSHGMMWGHTIESICEELGLTVSFYTARAISPWVELPLQQKSIRNFTVSQREAFDRRRMENLKAWAPDVVILIDRWSVREDPFEHLTFLEYIKSCGSDVILVGQPPELAIDGVSVPLFMAYQYDSDAPTDVSTLGAHRKREVDAANARIKELADTFDFCHFVPIADLYEVEEDKVLVRDGDKVLYIDEDHLSEAGVKKAKARLKQEIKRVGQSARKPILF